MTMKFRQVTEVIPFKPISTLSSRSFVSSLTTMRKTDLPMKHTLVAAAKTTPKVLKKPVEPPEPTSASLPFQG